LHGDQYQDEFYNAGPKIPGAYPQKFLLSKTCKIWPDFGRLQSSAANISGRYENIQKLKSDKYILYRNSSRVGRKKFGELQYTIHDD